MHDSVQGMLRTELSVRRQQLGAALAGAAVQPRLQSLLAQVDEALARMDAGRFGLCDVCNDPIETDRLLADPLVRLCLDHLTRAEASALERDLELARRVQQSLLPSSPCTSGSWRMAYHYRPAGIVSGDFCDVVAGREGDQYFLLGDAAGKGVAASMLMTQMHGMFRALIPTGLPLGQLVERVSALLCESTLPTHYATLVCGKAWPSGEVEVCNAGHPPVLLVRDCGVDRLEATGMPIGMFCNQEFSLLRTAVAPGEIILL